ncbi:OmpW family outer membrane protein [Paraburkholderia sp. C35]|uniref:OmpW/AlkL family protein n=1 Tax=Paraburkholderia sp. C35 TaxID=2126993 RepID=UPI000D688E8E|nr:OmpW family outer membrane protein [Paraburkholderia sp. C35]
MRPLRAIAIAAALLTGTAAHAQSAGSFVANVGWFHLAPQSSSQPFSINALGSTTTASGSGASVDGSDTVGLTAAYFVTDHIAVEGVFGIPPKFTLDGTGTLAGLGELGKAYEWSPTLLLKYYFNDAQAHFRPYLGAGAAYVWYSGVKLSSAMSSGAFLYSSTTGSLLEGPTSAKLSNSFAPVINAGFTYNFDKHWSAGVSLSYMWLSTRATLTTHSSVGTVTSTSKLHIDPIVSFVSVGYRF